MDQTVMIGRRCGGSMAVAVLALLALAANSNPITEAIQNGHVSNIKLEADPTAALISVTDKFTALPIDRESAIAGAVCSEVSRMSQKGDAGPEDGVGLCDLVLTGTDNKIGAVSFDEDGHAVTRWETWYLRSKKK